MHTDNNKKIYACTILFIFIAALFFPGVNAITGNHQIPSSLNTAQWWNTNWSYRKVITIDRNQVDSTVNNFPVLINLPSDTNLAAHTQPDGDDIVFTDGNANKLNHEIELFTSATGRLITWVNVPILSSTTDTILYMYYGNDQVDNQQNPQGTWDSSYLMVHHMEETDDIYDSTSHGLNAVNYGTTTDPNGKIDGCRSYNSTTDRYDFGNNTLLNPGMSSWTITLWTKITYVNNYDMLVKYSASSNTGFFINLNNNANGYNYIKVGDGTQITARYWNANWSDGTWHYITAIINRNTNKLDVYLDGSLHNGGGQGNITGFSSISSTTNLRFYGGIEAKHDEFTISTTVRNAGWIKTSYNNQNNPGSFYSLGDEQTQLPPPPITGPSWGLINVNYTFSTTMTNPNEDTLYCQWDWDDGNISGWLGPYTSGETAYASHTWSQTGTYEIRVKVKDDSGQESGWSTHTITISGLRQAIIFGSHENKDTDGDFIIIHAQDLRMLLIKPLQYNHFVAGESIILSNVFKGIITKQFIIGLFEVLI